VHATKRVVLVDSWLQKTKFTKQTD